MNLLGEKCDLSKVIVFNIESAILISWDLIIKLMILSEKLYLFDLPNSLHLYHASKQHCPNMGEAYFPVGFASLNLCSNSISACY